MTHIEPPVSTELRPVREKASFLEGLALGLNAVPDVRFQYEGFAEFLSTTTSAHGRHDHGSTLSSCRGGPPFVVAPARCGDFLDGYGAALETLAAGVNIDGAKPVKGCVALVGYMMDRNEGDHRGNVGELERMLRALGLKPVSTWLSGRPLEHLREVRRADAIISLPHGREAARILAGRLGVKLVDVELPFGLPASQRFMERLGREFDRDAAASVFIEAELDAVVPRLQWSVPHAFLNRRFSFTGDPHYAPRFAEFIEELGGRMTGMREADLIVAHTRALLGAGPMAACLEFGFPSDCTHFLAEAPFLGFPGALAFASRLANEIVKGFYLARGKP